MKEKIEKNKRRGIMKKQKLRKNKGITLIALVITIIVLLILAGVSIAMLTGQNGAQKAKSETENAAKNEAAILDEYNKYLNNAVGGGTVNTPSGSTLSQADGNQTNNIVVQDSLGNKIEVPKGFKVVNTSDNVEAGIIIEDVSAKDDITKGSQFVWIPVGEIYRKDNEPITINLDRYTFAETTGNEAAIGEAEINEFGGNFCQELSSSEYGNKPARNIETFKIKVTDGEAKGFYLGRYEARNNNNAVSLDKNYSIYNDVTQSEAATLSQNMYGKTEKFTSDLVNSYAWDTALVFIQKCSGDTRYSQQNSLNTGSLADKGTTNDVKCNIYDMASNCFKWSTETEKNKTIPCVSRGGNFGESYLFAGTRDGGTASDFGDSYSFRPLLYL